MQRHRWASLLAIALLAALIAVGHRAAPVDAQQIPWPAAVFFGNADLGSAAVLDGQTAADETIVTAWNEHGRWVQDAIITGATWVMRIDPHSATSLTFAIGDSERSADPIAVISGLATAVTLILQTPVAVAPTPSVPAPEPNDPKIEESPHIEISLVSTAGVSFVAWTSIETDAASAFDDVDNLDAVWWWNGADWKLFAPNAPASLSTNFHLAAGDVIFVLSSGPVTVIL
jgi:hypothetical protein